MDRPELEAALIARGQQPFRALQGWLETPLLPDSGGLMAAGAGAVVVSLLALARQLCSVLSPVWLCGVHPTTDADSRTR